MDVFYAVKRGGGGSRDPSQEPEKNFRCDSDLRNACISTFGALMESQPFQGPRAPPGDCPGVPRRPSGDRFWDPGDLKNL